MIYFVAGIIYTDGLAWCGCFFTLEKKILHFLKVEKDKIQLIVSHKYVTHHSHHSHVEALY